MIVLEFSANDKTGAIAEPVEKLYLTVLSQLPPLPGVGDALQQPFSILKSDRRAFNLMILAINNDDWRLTNLQPQAIRSIRVNKMQ